ncbi:MAG: hypothetical protein K0B84_03520 [Firmicutes bacterium]|nr:hypothetical protein [Bacillota bacterium]
MSVLTKEVPKALRIWFIVHFIIDFIFAIPLMFVPVLFLSSLGWQVVDPIAARLVSAALFGIGLESLLCYKAPVETYKGMLNLKIIWSTAAIAGLLISLLQEDQGKLIVLSLLLVVFLFFNGLWVFWKIKIAKL